LKIRVKWNFYRLLIQGVDERHERNDQRLGVNPFACIDAVGEQTEGAALIVNS